LEESGMRDELTLMRSEKDTQHFSSELLGVSRYLLAPSLVPRFTVWAEPAELGGVPLFWR